MLTVFTKPSTFVSEKKTEVNHFNFKLLLHDHVLLHKELYMNIGIAAFVTSNKFLNNHEEQNISA